MELTIRHFIPGRVRLYIPSLCRRRSLAEAALAWLRARPGIKGARVNYDCASLVVEYDVAQEMLLRAMIGRLQLMSIGELRALVAAMEAPPQPPAVPGGGRLDGTQSLLRRVPLVLPTLSVALAFSANPVVRAINLPLMLWNAYPIALRGCGSARAGSTSISSIRSRSPPRSCRAIRWPARLSPGSSSSATGSVT